MNVNKLRQLIIAVIVPVVLSINFWFITPEITMASVVGLVVLWSLLIGLAPSTGRLLAFAAASLLLAIVCAPVFGAFIAVSIFLFFGSRECEENQRGFFHAMLFATAGFCVLSLIDRTGLLWNETSKLAWQISHELIYTNRRPERLGMFHLGLVPVVFSVLLLVSRYFIFKAALLDHVFFLFAIIVATILCAITKTQYLLLFFPAFLTFGRAFERTHFPASGAASTIRWAGAALCAVGLSVLAVSSLTGTGVASDRSRNVMVLDGGLKSLQRPDSVDFDSDDGALFGGFCYLIECNGWDCNIVEQDRLNQELEPGSVDLLVIINPTEEFSAVQQDVLTRYVTDGGKMLVLGDHTDIGGVMKPLNQAISMTDIEFKFDSAIPVDRWSQWRRSLRGGFHPVFKECENSDTGISVGASLDCTGDSRILVQAISGYSDRGRPDFGISRLGDMAHNIGEESGDLALVAEQSVGKGIVQVWGDTSGLQDGRLFLTADFMSLNMAWLTDYRKGFNLPRITSATMLGLTLFGAVFFSARSPQWLLGTLSAMFAGIFVIHSACDFEHDWRVNGYQVVFDDSHMARYPEEEFSKGYSRLYELCLRSGHYLRRCDDFSALQNDPAVWVINAPVSEYSGAEALELIEYVKRGGNLVLVSGQDSASQMEEIMSALEVDIDQSPYGAAHNSRLMMQEWRDYVLMEGDVLPTGEVLSTGEVLPEGEAVTGAGTALPDGVTIATGEDAGVVSASNRDEATNEEGTGVSPGAGQPSGNPIEMSDDERLAVVTDDESEDEAAYDAEISFRESYPIILNDEDSEFEVLVSCWERPLIVRRQIGAGRVHFIADSRFLLDENLEFGAGAYKRLNLENAKLIVKCLER